MSKGIIVVDMPETCGGCPCFKDEDMNGDWCGVTGEYIYAFSVRDEYCPIKPLPEKIQHKSRHGLLQEQVALGWNLCIDEIKGE